MAKAPERLPRTTTPRLDIPYIYKAYFQIIQELGAIDGLASAIILATRALRAASGSTTLEQRSYIETEAAKFAVNTRFVDFDRLEPNSAQLLLVGVIQQAEAFTDGLRLERTAMGRPWGSRPDGMPKLHHLMTNLGDGFAANLRRVGKERYLLLDYYRNLRNAFAHGPAERTELEHLFEGVSQYRELVADEYRLDAPNHYDSLSYDDYMLATRVMKYLATDFCRLAEPSSADEIVSLLQSRMGGPLDPIKILMGKRGTQEKLVRTLRGWLDMEYSYEIAHRPEIEAGVIGWLNAIPNRRDRLRAGVRPVSQYLANQDEVD
jgi:hypothetical protein